MNWDFQKSELCLEWAEEQRSNCKHSLEHGERKGIQKSICFCFIDYTKCFDRGYNKKLWKILKEMGISEHLTCFLKNLLASQEAPVRTGHGSPVQFSRSVRFFVTPWTSACQASLSITNSGSLLKLMSIESVMPSNHLILCHPLLLLPSAFTSIRVFSNESVPRIRWPKYWSFSFSISPSNEDSGLISSRMDWLDLLAVLRSSPTPQFKSTDYLVLSFLYDPTLTF